jgi:hypothetical protein
VICRVAQCAIRHQLAAMNRLQQPVVMLVGEAGALGQALVATRAMTRATRLTPAR